MKKEEIFPELTAEEKEYSDKKQSFGWCSFFCQTCGLRCFPCGRCNHCHPHQESPFQMSSYCTGCERELCCEDDEACMEDFEDRAENYYAAICERVKKEVKKLQK